MSKKIKKCITDKKRTRRQEQIQRILEEFRCIKNIFEHQICKKKTLIPKVKSEKGETVTSRKGIANVFGKFHSKLYAEERLDEEEHDPHRSETRTSKRGRSGEEEEKKEIPEFTKKEVQAAIDSLKKAKQATAMESVRVTSRHM